MSSDQSCDDLNITCKKEGYNTVSDRIEYTHKGSAAGNIILGGGIGYLVDRGTGAACKYPNSISLPMSSKKLVIYKITSLELLNIVVYRILTRYSCRFFSLKQCKQK